MRLDRLSATSLALGVILLLGEGPLSVAATAQRTTARKDSVAVDSLADDSVRYRATHPPFMYLAIPAGLAGMMVLLFAPAPLARWLNVPDSTHAPLLRNHTSVSVALGGVFQQGETWTHALNAETFRNDVHLELQVEDFWRPHHIQYITVRGGYLWHPRKSVAGGVTLGYMHADRQRAQRGAELGLPLIVANSSGSNLRFEPTYVIGRRGPVYNYRVQGQIVLGRSPYFVGGSIVGKGNPPPVSPEYPGNFTSTGFMVLFGTRF